METIFWTRALLAALALALAVAAVGDWRRRLIENWLTGGIALAAPLVWWANHYALWPDIGVQIVLATGLFVVFLVFFAMGAMGGGDVKLIAALGLWFPIGTMLTLLLVMSVFGGILTLAMLIHHKLKHKPGRPEIPYGIAISAGGLWVIFQTIF
jgi:prepilin peptidase CpaA